MTTNAGSHPFYGGVFMENFYGAIPSPIDHRDYRAKDYIIMGIRPKEYVPEDLAPILNQGNIGSCVAHALVTMKWYQEHKERKSTVQYSTDYIYHNRLETDYQGNGMIVREALSQLHKCGVCEYVNLPTNTAYPNKGTKNCIIALSEEAKPQKINTYVRCANTDEICAAIYQNGAAILCVQVKSSFSSFYLRDENNFTLPVPKDEEKSFGYHCICAIGYTENGIIIQNSWGEVWGHNGLAVLPWDYPITEAWSVTDIIKEWDIVEIKIGENIMKVNGEEIIIDVPAQIKNGRTLLPVRAISTAFDCDCEWIEKERKVILRKERKG